MQSDVIIVGGGLAGIMAAFSAQADGAEVLLIDRGSIGVGTNSILAGGGFAAPTSTYDSDAYIKDTLQVGKMINSEPRVKLVAREAPGALDFLRSFGLDLIESSEHYFLKPPRNDVIPGVTLMKTLAEKIRDLGRVDILNSFYVTEILKQDGQVSGVRGLDKSGRKLSIHAPSVVMATGGGGAIYLRNDNQKRMMGQGYYLAAKAGLGLWDMEFVQFHPTGIYKLGILISEAARGEGAVLRNNAGERFMEHYAPVIKDLAPRDMVSRCILEEIRAGRGIDGKDYVHLDLTHLGAEAIGSKLAEIIGFARTYAGVDAAKEPIPVQPTCHYMMGGIATDADSRVILDEHRAPFTGLYAAGECACVSVHGANRLGCNSLLDTLVFGRRAGIAIRRFVKDARRPKLSSNPADHAARKIADLMDADGGQKSGAIAAELQAVMMENVSVFRHASTLKAAQKTVRRLKERSLDISLGDKGSCFNRDLLDALELGHLLDLAEVITAGALYREESRGAHSREDFPRRDDNGFLHHTMARYSEKGPQIFQKPVAVTRFQPKERKY